MAKLLRTFSTQATFSYHNFEDTVTNFDKDMFRKRIFLWYELEK